MYPIHRKAAILTFDHEVSAGTKVIYVTGDGRFFDMGRSTDFVKEDKHVPFHAMTLDQQDEYLANKR